MTKLTEQNIANRKNLPPLLGNYTPGKLVMTLNIPTIVGVCSLHVFQMTRKLLLG